ncbi:hypothetical protein FB446DRAFT_790883 [Lentinula raphanica]|nr:hypothetical protein FB446DRAFT_790883 [Lentinula raphanica]
MIRFAFQAILILGVISSGLLAAPTSMPRSIVELQAVQSSDPAIGGPPVVSMLETRADGYSTKHMEYLTDVLKSFLPKESNPEYQSLLGRIEDLVRLNQEEISRHKIPEAAGDIMRDALSSHHIKCIDPETLYEFIETTVTCIRLWEDMNLFARTSEQNAQYIKAVTTPAGKYRPSELNKILDPLWRSLINDSKAPPRIHDKVKELTKEIDAMRFEYHHISGHIIPRQGTLITI